MGEKPVSVGSSNGHDDELVNRLLDEQRYRIVYQPIVDLVTGRIFANEALMRPLSPELRGVEEFIKEAVRVGRMGEFGRTMRGMAVRGCPDTALSINIEPSEFDEAFLVRPDDPIFRHRHPVYLEIRESTPLDYFDQCHFVLDEMRKRNALLAIDDFGAGYSNFKYIADLRPDVIKLDRKLIAGIEPGTRQTRLLRSIVHLAHEMDALVVAEGVETATELQVVRDAGVDCCQGYFFAYPDAPPPAVPWPVS